MFRVPQEDAQFSISINNKINEITIHYNELSDDIRGVCRKKFVICRFVNWLIGDLNAGVNSVHQLF